MPENVTYFRFVSGTGQQQSEKDGSSRIKKKTGLTKSATGPKSPWRGLTYKYRDLTFTFSKSEQEESFWSKQKPKFRSRVKKDGCIKRLYMY